MPSCSWVPCPRGSASTPSNLHVTTAAAAATTTATTRSTVAGTGESPIGIVQGVFGASDTNREDSRGPGAHARGAPNGMPGAGSLDR